MSGNGEQMTRHGAPPGASMSSTPSNQRSNLALRLVLFAALSALLLSALLIPRPASAEQPTTVWSGTLRVITILEGPPTIRGCQEDHDVTDNCSSWLTDNDFSHDGTDYRVTYVQYQTSGFSFGLDKVLPADLIGSLRLIINGRVYHLDTASVTGVVNTGDTVFWTMHGEEWEPGERVRLRLAERYFPTLTSQPFDYANVDVLTASERTPTRSDEGTAERYCYVGEGNPGRAATPGVSHSATTGTTIIRYPDGRTAEIPNPGPRIRTMFACTN